MTTERDKNTTDKRARINQNPKKKNREIRHKHTDTKNLRRTAAVAASWPKNFAHENTIREKAVVCETSFWLQRWHLLTSIRVVTSG